MLLRDSITAAGKRLGKSRVAYTFTLIQAMQTNRVVGGLELYSYLCYLLRLENGNRFCYRWFHLQWKIRGTREWCTECRDFPFTDLTTTEKVSKKIRKRFFPVDGIRDAV